MIDFDAVVSDDIFNSLCGKRISAGSSRTVYQCNIDKSLVVKIEHSQTFQNIYEWDAWIAVRDTELAKWFAPCHSISNNGKVLIQAMTNHLAEKSYPTELPKFFTDIKPENFGFIGESFVCHDYAHHLMKELGMDCGMKDVHWNIDHGIYS